MCDNHTGAFRAVEPSFTAVLLGPRSNRDNVWRRSHWSKDVHIEELSGLVGDVAVQRRPVYANSEGHEAQQWCPHRDVEGPGRLLRGQHSADLRRRVAHGTGPMPDDEPQDAFLRREVSPVRYCPEQCR